MVGLFKVTTDNGIDLIRYVNDALYEKLGSYSAEGDPIPLINEYFEDSQYWFAQKIPYNPSLSSSQIELQLQVFPLSVEAVSGSYTLGGITLYDTLGVEHGNPWCVEASTSNDYHWFDAYSPFIVKNEAAGGGTTGVSPAFSVWHSSCIVNDNTLSINTEYPPKIFSVGIHPTGISVAVWNTDGWVTSWLNAGGARELPITVIYEVDPFAPGGTTGDDDTDPEGGTGNFENEDTAIDPPALPSLGGLFSGFFTLYNPSMTELQALGNFMWSDAFSIDTFKKLFTDPMQAILGLSIVPVSPSVTTSREVKIGNVSTGLTMNEVRQQYETVNCGTVSVPEYWGAYLDYAPYTKVSIALPYIGVRPLDTDTVMGKTVGVEYHIDLMSGACVCYISCDNTVRYIFAGQCASSIPVTSNDWTNVLQSAISVATAIGAGVATGGLSAMASGAVTAGGLAGAGAMVGGLASQVVGSKPRIEHSGSLSGGSGLLGIQKPFLMITRPRQALPRNQNTFTGYPVYITRTLGSVTGFTQVSSVHLTGLTCTEEEQTEIERQLKEGVIL